MSDRGGGSQGRTIAKGYVYEQATCSTTVAESTMARSAVQSRRCESVGAYQQQSKEVCPMVI